MYDAKIAPLATDMCLAVAATLDMSSRLPEEHTTDFWTGRCPRGRSLHVCELNTQLLFFEESMFATIVVTTPNREFTNVDQIVIVSSR